VKCALFGEHFRREQLKHIGYLPEERGLHRKMRLLDQLVFFAELKGVSSKDARQRAVYWCERLDLASWQEKRIDELSNGMQQKAQFIVCVLHNPELLIREEPFSGLDPANALVLKNVLLELKNA
jgi:ABC-2 type transport system ATP-binding protein